ncbi:MAG: NAD(P)H-dependent oxidoreductase subunit E [Elusimicrobiota bacterium]
MNTQNIISKYDKTEQNLLGVLEDIQSEYNYLSEENIRLVAKEFNVPLARVYGLANFYKAFSLKPKGKNVIMVCLGTACHVRGGPKLVDKIEQYLKIKNGETTPDGLFTLETVNCLGACALGPLMVINGHYYGKMSPAKMEKTIESYTPSK